MTDADTPLGPAPVDLYDCGSGRFWLREGGSVRLLEADDALLLQSIDGFRPLGEHVTLLERRGFVEAKPGDLAGRLDELRRRGLLISAGELCGRLVRGEETAAAIGWAAWVTRGRPALVARGVRSWIEGRAAGPRLAVVDDSADDGTRRALVELDASDLWYADREAKGAFAARLAARGIPQEALSFALSPPADLGTPYGANRNALLLATCGDVLLSSDDDILFDTVALPEAEDALEITSRLDPAGVRHYGGREALRAAVRPTGDTRALLSSHERLLGRDCGEWARADSVVLAELGRELALRLTRRSHRVLLTATGLYGDSGIASAWLLHLRDQSWRRITASGEAYEIARASREVVRCVPRATICETGYFTGHHFGLDNRGLLPPFFPGGRREDGIFALTLRVTHPRALAANVPVAVLHDRGAGPDGRAKVEGPPAPQPLLADLLSLLIVSCPPSRGEQDPAARMRALAAHLAGMASLEATDLEKWVRERWVGRWASEMALCEHRARGGPRDAPWVLDSAARIEQIAAHIEAGAAVHPRDLGAGSPAAAWEAARERIRRFAGLLEWWPAIVAAARELREREQGLLRPLHT